MTDLYQVANEYIQWEVKQREKVEDDCSNAIFGIKSKNRADQVSKKTGKHPTWKLQMLNSLLLLALMSLATVVVWGMK